MKIKNLKKHYRYKEIRETIEKQSIKSFGDIRALAEAYYKDLDLHKKNSYPIAIKLLEDIKSKENEDDNPSETLCLLGAIYKRKWEYERDFNSLYKAIENYEKAYTKFKNEEWYYGAINTSFLYETLANEFKDNDLIYSKSLEDKAVEIRNNIIVEFDREEMSTREDALWIKHTLAQAYLGVGDIENCKEKLKESNNIKNDDWETHTTYKHLKQLSDLRNIDDLHFLECLSPNSDYISFDKKGLALSGGGFRASFFHLGTLAKLAELNILRDIEVISTVSGGSIIGVLYYMKVQKLLEEKEDNEIDKKDYTDLVKELIDEFYDGVQKDIRNSVIKKGFLKNTVAKVLNPLSKYSRTEKLGELYQEIFYKSYKQTMHELVITPKDWKNQKQKFKPRFNNWNRTNKVPILVINSTNLNSGHTWQFQATKMGEPEYMTNMEVDKNNSFGWVRYDDYGLKKEFKEYSIGQAVASSSAVPLLFPPIYLDDLYEGYRLSISDGGVYDNQGFSGLLSEECDYLICSDASGQMNNKEKLTKTLLKTNTRIIDIQMDRNRELAFEEVNKLYKNKILKGFVFTHLKKNIDSQEISHKNDIYMKDKEMDFQQIVSEIRTDLDKFSKIEAYSLIYNGYILLENEFNSHEREVDWQFLENDIDYEKNKHVLKELAQSK
ncbi:MAG: patatin-like phospholipase family protein, partial [Campylobacterales bacterium]|nr:patatin-like phospholipase family protein [Campylobacterales bacterium]